MARQDDIHLSLPDPPPPAPARREAAIEAALRRFDGSEEATPAPRGKRMGSRPLLARPYLGMGLAVSLLALVASPMLWMSGNRQQRPPEQATIAATHRPQTFNFVEAPPALREQPPVASRAEPPAVPAPTPASPPPPAAIAAADRTSSILAAPAPLPPSAIVQSNRVEDADMRASAEMHKAAPLEPTVLAKASAARGRYANDDGDIIVTSRRRDTSRLEGRGDWNACTVNDPQPNLSACRQFANPAAKGNSGIAAGHLADGLTHAWSGDPDAAIADFDRAIAIAPRCSFAYLNRGLAHRTRGDQDQALADLDRAVRYAPQDARAYYYRSLLMDERGETRKAKADRQRAATLDDQYQIRR